MHILALKSSRHVDLPFLLLLFQPHTDPPAMVAFTPSSPTLHHREGLPAMDRRWTLAWPRNAVASFIFLVLLVACAEGFRFPFPTARAASR